MQREIVVCKDADALAVKAADRLIQTAEAAIRSRGKFMLALSGGSTPEKMYSLLTQPNRVSRIDWSSTYIFFGDERFVPPTDPRSNHRMAQNALLSLVPVAVDHLFPVATNAPTPAESAAVYARTLAKAFAIPESGEPPSFDLILLGLGDDGHTASLFPSASALKENRAWVTWSPPGTLPPPVDRVTFTFEVLNAARQVMFLVSGSKKAIPLQDVLEGGAGLERRPAAGVQPANGQLIWLVDKEAASLLKIKT